MCGIDPLLFRPFRAWRSLVREPRAALRGYRRSALPWAAMFRPLRGEGVCDVTGRRGDLCHGAAPLWGEGVCIVTVWTEGTSMLILAGTRATRMLTLLLQHPPVFPAPTEPTRGFVPKGQ